MKITTPEAVYRLRDAIVISGIHDLMVAERKLRKVKEKAAQHDFIEATPDETYRLKTQLIDAEKEHKDVVKFFDGPWFELLTDIHPDCCKKVALKKA